MKNVNVKAVMVLTAMAGMAFSSFAQAGTGVFDGGKLDFRSVDTVAASAPANVGNAPAENGVQGKDAIDLELEACLNSPDGESTMGMRFCLSDAYQKKDAKLNKTYKEVLNKVSADPAKAAALKLAQQKWIAYRDAQLSFMQALYTPEETGTMGPVTVSLKMIDIVNSQIKLLESYNW